MLPLLLGGARPPSVRTDTRNLFTNRLIDCDRKSDPFRNACPVHRNSPICRAANRSKTREKAWLEPGCRRFPCYSTRMEMLRRERRCGAECCGGEDRIIHSVAL